MSTISISQKTQDTLISVGSFVAAAVVVGAFAVPLLNTAGKMVEQENATRPAANTSTTGPVTPVASHP